MDKYIKDIKEKLSEVVDYANLDELVEIPKDETKGNYCIVCFRLAKVLKKNPAEIAKDIKEVFEKDSTFEKVEVVGGYVNLYINKQEFAKYVMENIENILPETYDFGKGKNVCIDYSSPNIAKEFHIGHLRTTLIGFALYNLYKKAGYNITSINHLGDYGTQFGKLIEGYTLFGNDKDLSENPLERLTQIYVKISELCKNDEQVLQRCRDNFKKLEDGDTYCQKLYDEFKKISIAEFNKVYDMLGITFDSWNGEAFYVDKMHEVEEILEKNNKLVQSEGATIVDLTDEGIETPLLIRKSNGSTTYATRDLAAILYRARTYDYDKSLYVTSNEQILHFKQIFKTAKFLDLDQKYVDGLEHISYGMVLLPTGKMSTRGGNVVKLKDLFDEAISEANNVIEQKNPDLENKEETAKKVGIGAVIFNDLSTSRNKDEIFNLSEILNFQGETGPYIQYTFVRIKSILEKYEKGNGGKQTDGEIDYSVLTDSISQKILSEILKYPEVICQTLDKSEPSIFARYILNMAKLFSNFYNENRIMREEENIQKARIALIRIVKDIIENSCNLIGIQMPERM